MIGIGVDILPLVLSFAHDSKRFYEIIFVMWIDQDIISNRKAYQEACMKSLVGSSTVGYAQTRGLAATVEGDKRIRDNINDSKQKARSFAKQGVDAGTLSTLGPVGDTSVEPTEPSLVPEGHMEATQKLVDMLNSKRAEKSQVDADYWNTLKGYDLG